MLEKGFTPIHINATAEDFEGNNGIGRYLFFPGSPDTASQIASHFDHHTVKEHPREHNLHLGSLTTPKGKTIQVAALSGGMGTPSNDIIMNECVKLGCKRFLRVGTCGSLQPNETQLGDFIVATAAVRDEGTSRNYLPIEFPAVGSIEMVNAAIEAMHHLKIEEKVHVGIMQTKDSLYAREFMSGPMQIENERYMDILKDAGVYGSEMEASLIYTAGAYYDAQLRKQGKGPQYRFLTGSICTILSNGPDWANHKTVPSFKKGLIEFCIKTILCLADQELK